MKLIYSLSRDGEQRLSNHFKVKEFASRDGAKIYSDTIIVYTELISLLENLFSKLNCGSINIISGYRTPQHSINVGGYSTDQHTIGTAADIACYDINKQLISPKLVCCALQDLGANGIGRMANTTHTDVRFSGHWWGDEITGKSVTNWYTYFDIPKEITSAEHIVWALGEFGIVTDKAGMLDEIAANPNGRLYWLARKALSKIAELQSSK